jgi:hypothetical protein
MLSQIGVALTQPQLTNSNWLNTIFHLLNVQWLTCKAKAQLRKGGAGKTFNARLKVPLFQSGISTTQGMYDSHQCLRE